jgi:hypothetical protein
MKYDVAWLPGAHDRLERIWMAAADNKRVLRAANQIDYLLASDPHLPGAIHLGDENTLIVEPLAVDYRVVENERRVLILSVWMIGYLDENTL